MSIQRVIMHSDGIDEVLWEGGKEVRKSIINSDYNDGNGIGKYMREPLEIEGNVTLINFFNILLNFPPEEMKFIGDIAWCDIDLFAADTFDEVDKKYDDLEYLEVENLGEIWDHGDGAELTVCQGFHALAKPDEKGWRQPWGFDGCNLYSFSHLPIRINNELEIWRWDKTDDDRPTAMDKMVYNITLGEFIHAILYEVSFYGTPTRRKEFFEEMSKRVEDVQSGKAKLITWDEVKKKFEDKKDDGDK